MDELAQQIGMAIGNISDCIPRAEGWGGPAAAALTRELEQLSTELGAVVLDLVSGNVYSALERLQIG